MEKRKHSIHAINPGTPITRSGRLRVEVGLMVSVERRMEKMRDWKTSRKTSNFSARSLVIGFRFSVGISMLGLRNLCNLRMEMKQMSVLAVPNAFMIVWAFELGLRSLHSVPEMARFAIRTIRRTGMIWKAVNQSLYGWISVTSFACKK